MKIHSRFACLLLGLAIAAVVGAGAVWSCGAEYYPSVHFNSQQPDFGLPPRPFSVSAWGELPVRPLRESTEAFTPMRRHWESDWEASEAAREAHERRLATLLAEARRREAAGLYADAARAYEQYAQWGWANRAGLRDRVEVLRQVTPATDRGRLSAYLAARDLYDGDRLTRAEDAMRAVYADPAAGFLRAHALYGLASIAYTRGDRAAAADLYQKLAREFRGSPRRETALIMAARSLLGVRPAVEGLQAWEGDVPPAAAVQRGKALLWQLLEQYPETRYRANAFGWLGRVASLEKRTPEAFRYYLKQMAAAGTQEESISAMASIRWVTKRMSAGDASRLAALLRAEPPLAVPYLEFRLYHSPRRSPADFAALAQLAEALVREQGAGRVPFPILVGLAHAGYRAGKYRACRDWARRAIAQAGARGSRAGLDRAYYLSGSARHKLKERAGAIRDYSAVLGFPASNLRAAARENLAILYEERGDLGRALEQYFALGHDGDIAFLLDARMSTRQVEGFIGAHPRHPARDLLVYSLGMRHLRAGSLASGERAFRRLPAARVRELSKAKGDLPDIEERLHDPLVTIARLRTLQAAVDRARGADARAQAGYALASYYYDNRNLLLYNAALWGGSRAYLFDFHWNTDHATPKDEDANRAHHYEHECANRARVLCLSVARRYPRSPVAPKALYRAACCARRLADFSHWWRRENAQHDFWKESARLMDETARRYPRDPLAGTARKYAAVFRKEAAGYLAE